MEKEIKLSIMDKRLKTIAEKTEKTKIAIVRELRRTPIVEIACSRTGVGRSTYYKWRAHDTIFARAADDALASGRFLINDMAESQIIKKIKEGSLPAEIFWLKYNHPNYSRRDIHEYDAVCRVQSTEERHIWSNWFTGMFGNKLAGIGIREQIEQEERAYEQGEKEREEMKIYEEEDKI